VIGAGRKLSVYFGERDRCDGRFLAERVVAELDAAGMRAAILMRGAEGYGAKHRVRTDRLLTLSEDLPVVAIGVGGEEAVDAAAARIGSLPFAGLVVTEEIAIAGADGDADAGAGGWSKLSIYVGRGRRIDGRPAYEWLLGRLHASGAGAAVALVGVDGILGGARRRAGFFARNADVPALIVAVGEPTALIAVADDVAGTLPGDAVPTLERTHVVRSGDPAGIPAVSTPSGARRLMLFANEQDHVGGRPVHVEAVRRLREAGAAGATVLRGVRGFSGGCEPRGESLLALRRSVPTLTLVVDAPDRCERWLQVLGGLAPEHALVLSEEVGLVGARPEAAQSSPEGTS
jgi:PII-like signaling protein